MMEKGLVMLRLKNVSKFYYSNGMIASGFSRVNLELDMGEFVVITGESGSGKSTLLNVLPGLDTFEEGEMYIYGQETSHYNEADFEEYRRKYVGNIFQNFNLVNSYTVYQNVELALMLNGETGADMKERVRSIIDKVGLTDFINTKCSKLSGGQKQRVAIARALAKETPIIVADEPTGNLDSKAAEDVIRLLDEIARDKLVIIVTHNLEQVEKYATRLIKMHDGKILEDKTVKRPDEEREHKAGDYEDITFGGRLKLGVRNAFNIPAKFILIFAVFLFISFAVAGTYSSFQKTEYQESLFGYNEFFSDTSDSRIVINKPDKSAITEDEFKALESMENVRRVIKDDTLIDYVTSISDEEYWFYFYGNFVELKYFDGELTAGRMPENPYEIILEGSPDDYYLDQGLEEILNTDLYIDSYDSDGERQMGQPLKVVGVYMNEELSGGDNNRFYAGEELLGYMRQQAAADNNNVKSLYQGQYYMSSGEGTDFRIVPNANVPSGEAFVSSRLNETADDGNCIGKQIVISTESIYGSDSMTVKISKTYSKSNLEKLTGVTYKDSQSGEVYVNEEDYNRLINKGIFQSSVYVDDVKGLDTVIEDLEGMGFNTLAMRDARAADGADIVQIVSMMKTFMLAVLIIALFFISYFIIRIVLKSRNAYYTTLRTLGASRRISKQLLDIELFVTATLAYAVFMAVMLLVYAGVITQTFAVDLAGYLEPANYVIMYLIIIAMSYMISQRFARKLFKDSVMNTYREEV